MSRNTEPKYSDAILLGSASYKQAFGLLATRDGERCANGCAMEAAGFNCPIGLRSGAKLAVYLWPWAAAKVACPACHSEISRNFLRMSVATVVEHLNDAHFWSLAQIAAWVAEQERLHCPETTDGTVTVPHEAEACRQVVQAQLC